MAGEAYAAGENLTFTIEGRQRFPVRVRTPGTSVKTSKD